MADFEIDIAEQLLQIFPNLNRDIIDISIKHPSNRTTPLNVTNLVQNCIDDLLELRTYTETTGTRSGVTKNNNEKNISAATASSVRNSEDSYRENPYVIHSDESSDEDMVHFAEKVDAGLFQDLSAESSPDDCVITNPAATTSEKNILPSKLLTTVKNSETVTRSPPVSPIKKATFSYSSPSKEVQTSVGNPLIGDVSPSTWKEWRKTKDGEVDSELPNLISPSAFKKKPKNISESNFKNSNGSQNNKKSASVSNISETITLATNSVRGDNKNNAEVTISSSSHGNIMSKDDDGKYNISQKKPCPTISGNTILPNFSKTEVRNSGEIPGVKLNTNNSVTSGRNIGTYYRTPTYLNESESTDSSTDDEFPEEHVTFQEVVKSENVKQSASNKLDLQSTLNDLYNFSRGSVAQQRGNFSNNTLDVPKALKGNIKSSQGTDIYRGHTQRTEISSTVSNPHQLNRTNQSSDSNPQNRSLPSSNALDSGPTSDIDKRGVNMKPKKAETITTTTEDTLVIDNPRPGCSHDGARPSMVKYETEIKQDSCILKIKRVIETNHSQDNCPVSVSTSCTISSHNNNSLNPDKPCVINTNTGRQKLRGNLLDNGTNVLDNPHHNNDKTMHGNDNLDEIEIDPAVVTSTEKTNKVGENPANGWMNVNVMKGQQSSVPVVDLTKNERDSPTTITPIPTLVNQIPEPTIVIPEPTILAPEPEPEELTPEKQVLALFPDVEPDYLKRLMNLDFGNDVNNICNHLLEFNYPKKQQQNIESAPVVQQNKKSTKNYYKEYSNIILERAYVLQCETMLQNEFKWISVKDIRMILKHFNGHYAPTHNILRDVMLKRQKDAEKDLLPNSSAKVETTFKVGDDKEFPLMVIFLKCSRSRRYLSTIVPDLQEELDFVAESLLELAEESDRQLAFEINEHEYEDTGQLIECGCCYGEIAFESMVQCYEGHLFCQDCLKNYAKESVFGQGKADLLCMTEGCDASFPVSQLSKALPSNILEKYEDRVKEENINLADLADLVRCPHCEFAALMDPGDKVFKCQSSSCMKETCRYCKEEWTEHFGKRCEEIEKKDETKLRLEFEEKMTEVQIRTCPKCKARFTKSEGCNKMTCRCGATMCYICRKPNISYKHFCQHVRNPGKPCDQCEDCFLWSNPEEDEKRAIEEIRKEANEARIEKGYTEDKYIGAKDLSAPPVKKQRLS